MRAPSFSLCNWRSKSSGPSGIVRNHRSRQPGLGFPLPGIPRARIQSQEQKVPELSGLRPSLAGRAGIGRFSRPRLVGSGNGSGPIGKSGIERRRRASVRVLAPGGGRVPQSARLRLCLSRNSGVPPLVLLETGTPSAYVRLAQRLLDMYESVRRPDWKWFENVVAYGNAQAAAGHAAGGIG